MLPTILPILESLTEAAERVEELYEALRERSLRVKDLHELTRERIPLQEAEEHAHDLRRQIMSYGIVVRSDIHGLVDFLSERNGEQVWLCFIKGEKELNFYHGLQEGFAHRKPIDFE